MKISYKWLKDYVDFDLSPEELAQALTMIGLDVESVESTHISSMDNVLVGVVNSIESHPQAEKLNVCQVSIGKKRNLRVITGATNVQVGDRVPIALPGAVLPDGTEVKEAEIRGVRSEGMLCSRKELGVSDDHSGIMILSPDLEVGTPVKDALNLNDSIIDISIPANRVDCASIVGIAREVSTITGSPLKFDVPRQKGERIHISNLTSVTIRDYQLCPRYAARVVKNVYVTDSPEWLRQRLESVGIRSINNIADITNFVMMEMGQPLHAFDFNKLRENRIVVRRAEDGETITTLDGVTRELDHEMLVIADASLPVAIAGIMGGLDTEISEKTTTVLIESAHFNPVSIRRTSKRLGLFTEASYRFERNIDIEGVRPALDRAAQLMRDVAGGCIIRGTIDNYPKPQSTRTVNLRPSRVNIVLGSDFEENIIKETLQRLSFKVTKKSNDLLKVEIPSYRNDVQREIDLVEEVARIQGYDKVKPTLPLSQPPHRGSRIKDEIHRILNAYGFYETVNYSFIDGSDLERIFGEGSLENTIRIANPMSVEQSVMRPTLLMGLLGSIKRNLNRKNTNVRIYEFGRVFSAGENGKPLKERELLAGAMCGTKDPTWNERPQPPDFYDIKGVVESILEIFDLSPQFIGEKNAPFHPGKSATIKCECSVIGKVGAIHPRILRQFEIPETYAFELDYESLKEIAPSKTYKPIPIYPAILRDVALIVEDGIPADSILRKIRELGGTLIENVRIFDVYKGSQIPEGKKSVAYSICYRAEDRTLTDDEVSRLHWDIVDVLKREFKAEIR